MHFVNDIIFQNPDDTYNVVVEIPAGSHEKWQADAQTGTITLEYVNGRPRLIPLSYPFNYGFIPQTLLSKAHGGDGDPLDAFIIAPALTRGATYPCHILGGLDLVDRGETDTKIIAILPQGHLQGVNDLQALRTQYPGVLEIIYSWFAHYKGVHSPHCQGEITRQQGVAMIAQAHQDWKTVF